MNNQLNDLFYLILKNFKGGLKKMFHKSLEIGYCQKSNKSKLPKKLKTKGYKPKFRDKQFKLIN